MECEIKQHIHLLNNYARDCNLYFLLSCAEHWKMFCVSFLLCYNLLRSHFSLPRVIISSIIFVGPPTGCGFNVYFAKYFHFLHFSYVLTIVMCAVYSWFKHITNAFLCFCWIKRKQAFWNINYWDRLMYMFVVLGKVLNTLQYFCIIIQLFWAKHCFQPYKIKKGMRYCQEFMCSTTDFCRGWYPIL